VSTDISPALLAKQQWEAQFYGTGSINALELMCLFPYIPRSEITKSGPVSKGERKRMLDNRAISINGKKPTSKDDVAYPILEITFFPNSRNKCSFYYMSVKQAWSEHWERADRAWAKMVINRIGDEIDNNSGGQEVGKAREPGPVRNDDSREVEGDSSDDSSPR
jgi:hypothetical protein